MGLGRQLLGKVLSKTRVEAGAVVAVHLIPVVGSWTTETVDLEARWLDGQPANPIGKFQDSEGPCLNKQVDSP